MAPSSVTMTTGKSQHHSIMKQRRKLSNPPFHYSTIPVVQSTVYTLPCTTMQFVLKDKYTCELLPYCRNLLLCEAQFHAQYVLLQASGIFQFLITPLHVS